MESRRVTSNRTIDALNILAVTVIFSDLSCTSSFGPAREVVFSVQNGETHTIGVNSSFFQ